MNRFFPIFLLSLAFAASSSGATLAIYLNGTNSVAATSVSPGVSPSNAVLAGGEWRTTYGSPGTTPAGPNLGTSSGSTWRLLHGSQTPATPTSGNSSITATLTATSVLEPMLFTTLSFDLANAIHQGAAASVESSFTIFINDVALNPALISPGTTLLNTSNNTYVVQTFTADLSSLGPLTSLKFEIAIADDFTPTTGNVGNFVQGIHLQGSVVPEPGRAVLLVLGAAFAVLRRGRAIG